MDRKDWEKLSPEEQQRLKNMTEVEQRMHLKGKQMRDAKAAKATVTPPTPAVEPGECAAGLLELRNALKREMPDESSACQKYADMATKFTHLKEPQDADILRLISSEECLHEAVLGLIVEEITRKCGG